MAAALVILSVAGCAAPPLTLAVLPTASPKLAPPSHFAIREYPLIERSADNPDHPGFAQRARDAVARGYGLFSNSAHPGGDIAALNQALSPFGYYLAPNAVPPYSALSLYQDDHLLQAGILQTGQVTLLGGGSDFNLPYQTTSGDRYTASLAGIAPWSDESARTPTPLLDTGALAYNESGMEGASSVLTAGEQGRFGQQLLGGKQFYFETRSDHVFLNYDGRKQAYTYDLVIHGLGGENAIFNPGGDDQKVWFFALRDGLWYYVEVGFENS